MFRRVMCVQLLISMGDRLVVLRGGRALIGIKVGGVLFNFVVHGDLLTDGMTCRALPPIVRRLRLAGSGKEAGSGAGYRGDRGGD
jgi:hypothetical protein